MADTTEMQDIRTLDTDKVLKGFSLIDYTFVDECLVKSTNGDSVRWYSESSSDLSPVAVTNTSSVYPVANIGRLGSFANLEPSWTRNTSYVRKFAAESFLGMEDMKSADIDVLSRTLLRLKRSVDKQRDMHIFNVMTDGYSTAQAVSTSINSVAANAAWNTASFTGVDIIEDLLDAKLQLYNNGYNPEGATLLLSPQDHKQMVTWLISSKGASIPNFSSEKVVSGKVMEICGLNVKVSPNVYASGAVIEIPKTSVSLYELVPMTSKVIEDAGKGNLVRVWTNSVAVLTDPKSVCLIYNTQTHA